MTTSRGKEAVAKPTIIDAIADPLLFGAWLKGGSWRAWLVFLRALFGLPIGALRIRTRGDCDLAIFQRHTGRSTPPTHQAREAWLIVGRRGGKSFIVALIAVFLACFRDYSAFLAPGERGVVMILAADRRQARVILRYIRALLKGVAMLAPLIVAERTEAIELANGIDIEIHTASFRSVRGYAVVAALLDEVAYWPSDDSANPDSEIVAALRPAMATIPNALLIGISSPYSRRGELWNAYQRHFGKEGDEVLVWQAPSKAMNPTLPERVIEAAYEEDEARAAAEYGAEFRRDVEALFAAEALEAVTIKGRRELPPAADIRYHAFVDPSGGAADSMTLAIAHADSAGRRVLDLLREKKPPFSPEVVVAEFAETLKTYGIAEVVGDRYGGEWPRERFQKAGITYQVSEKTKSELYLEFLPVVTSGAAELLEHERLLRQLQRLERRTARSGKDSIDHAPGGHDDLANVAAGALVLAKPQADLSAALQDALDALPGDFDRVQATREHFRDIEFDATREGSKPWD